METGRWLRRSCYRRGGGVAEDWDRYGKWPRMLSLYKYLKAFARSRGRNGRSSLFSRTFLFSSFDFLPFVCLHYLPYPPSTDSHYTPVINQPPIHRLFFFISRTASGKKIYLCFKKKSPLVDGRLSAILSTLPELLASTVYTA